MRMPCLSKVAWKQISSGDGKGFSVTVCTTKYVCGPLRLEEMSTLSKIWSSVSWINAVRTQQSLRLWTGALFWTEQGLLTNAHQLEITAAVAVAQHTLCERSSAFRKNRGGQAKSLPGKWQALPQQSKEHLHHLFLQQSCSLAGSQQRGSKAFLWHRACKTRQDRTGALQQAWKCRLYKHNVWQLKSCSSTTFAMSSADSHSIAFHFCFFHRNTY